MIDIFLSRPELAWVWSFVPAVLARPPLAQPADVGNAFARAAYEYHRMRDAPYNHELPDVVRLHSYVVLPEGDAWAKVIIGWEKGPQD